MATRDPSRVGVDKTERTEFQMHKSQHPQFDNAKKKLVDFTEHKLVRLIATIDDAQQKQVLSELVEQYRHGRVAIAWKRGRPVYVDLVKEK